MAEFYNANNRKMMTHDSFSTSHEEILYMENYLQSRIPFRMLVKRNQKLVQLVENNNFPKAIVPIMLLAKNYQLPTFSSAKPIVNFSYLCP